MRNVFRICLIIWVIAFAATFVSKTNAQTKQPHILTPLDQKRIAIKKEWIAAAKKIYDQTQDPEAKMVVDAILPAMITAAPNPKGVMILEAAMPNAPWTYFVPLFASDKQIPMFRKFIDNPHIFASYGPDVRGLTVREIDPCSQFWKGISLLHEAHHAGDTLFEPYDWKNPQIFAAKERDVHNFENRLMAKIGGVAYNQLLQKEVARLRAELKKQGLNGVKRQAGPMTNYSLPNRTDYMPELDKILTPALSQMEKDARQTHFWIHAVFTLYEQDRGGADGENGKAAFLFTVYQSEGIFNPSN